jgi:hypothetical protein
VICLRSQKIDEDLGRAMLKCGGSVFVSNFDTRIALQTVLHDLVKSWTADRREDYDTRCNWLSEESSQRIEISDGKTPGGHLASLGTGHLVGAEPSQVRAHLF